MTAGCSSHSSHHAAHHRFDDAERWAKVFEDPSRDEWQRPQQVIDRLQLEPSMEVAVVGSGTGYFSVRLARHLPRGRVWGIDIEPSMVSYLNRRAAKEKLPQLSSLQGAPSDPKIPSLVDLIFICNTYHHIPDRVRYFRGVASRIKANGRLAIVDFKMGQIPVGPPEEGRVAPATLDEELTAAGFRRQQLDLKTLPYQYIAVYIR